MSKSKKPTPPSSNNGASPANSCSSDCPLADYKLVKLLPDTADYKQYVNLASDSKEPTHGREVELVAHLDKPVAGITVYFKLIKDAKNKDGLPSRMQSTGLALSMQRDASVHSSVTDEKGIAKKAIKLGSFGGDKFKGIASLDSACKENAAGSVSSTWITIWRRLWYQLTHHKALTPPSMSSAETKFKKAFIDFVSEPAVTHEKAANGSVIVGSHNATEYHALHKNLHPGQSVHVIFCDQQIDGSPARNNTVEAEFTKKDDFIKGTAGGTYILFDPPLAGGTLFVSGTWENLHSGDKGTLTGTAGSVTKNIGLCSYNDKNFIKVSLPDNAKPTATHKVKVKVTLSVASGPWGGDGGTAPHNLIKISSDDTVHTMCVMHEIGHLINMGPMSYSVNCPDGFEYGDHTKMYKSNGAHCYSGGSLVSGKGSGGTCIMYHQLNTSCTLEYCSLCLPFVKAMSLETFKDLKK